MTVKFERFNLGFWIWREREQLNIVTQLVGIISWRPGGPFWDFGTGHAFTAHTWVIFVYCFVCFCLAEDYLTTSQL